MSGQAHPWWASEGPVEGGIAPDEDPVERFRAARRGSPTNGEGASTPGRTSAGDSTPNGGVAGADAEPWLEAAAATMSRLARDLAQGSPRGGAAPPRGQAERPVAGEDRDGRACDGDGDGGHAEEPEVGDAGVAGAGDTADDTADVGSAAGATGGEPRAHTPDVCGVCPICVGLRALAESRPELVGHLAEAARHVALAARSLMDRPERDGAAEDEPLEHIDLD